MIERRLRAVLLGGCILLGMTAGAAAQQGAPAADEPKVFNTQDEVVRFLSRCWAPPRDVVHPGMEITIRFVFNRDGEVMGEPRFTYMTPGVGTAIRAAYQRSVVDMLNRCTPVKFTASLGGAVAGRPLALRFVDSRGQKRA
jgi:hypothetical protein